MTERTVLLTKNVDGEDKKVEVHLLYCNATETGFEQLTGKNISTLGEGTQDDWTKLCLAAIVAWYEYNEETMPITSRDLLFSVRSDELLTLFKAVAEARQEWYGVPAIMKKDGEDEAAVVVDEKN
jgi:hypothetical protein